MQNIVNLKCNAEGSEVLQTMVKKSMNIACSFCGGLGHTKQKCSTLRAMNRQMGFIGLRMSWGRAKANWEKYEIGQFVVEKKKRQETNANAV